MKGKYYGVYDVRNGDACVGVFENVDEICAFFGGIAKRRVWCAVCRDNALTFKAERFRVVVYREPTIAGVRRMMRRRFGLGMFKRSRDGIYTRQEGVRGWRFFAADLEEAVDRI